MTFGGVRAVFALFVYVLFAVFTLGCGSGPSGNNFTNPQHVAASSADPVVRIFATQNPLVAQYYVGVNEPASAWVEFGTDTAYGKQTFSQSTSSPSGGTIGLLVAGMKASTRYHMRDHVSFLSGRSWVDQDRVFVTGPLPARNQLGLKVTRPNPSPVPGYGVELLDVLATTGTNNLQAAVTDLDGNIIWYFDWPSLPGATRSFPFPIRPLPNGNMVVNRSDGRLLEVNLAGNVIRHLTLSDLNQSLHTHGYLITISEMHHDVLPLPNGHWILLASVIKTFANLPGYPGNTDVTGDVLIDVAPDWTPVWVWSSFDHLDVNRHLMAFPDWTHSNALVYSAND